MGDENVRQRTAAQREDGQPLTVLWMCYEEGNAWLWMTFAEAMGDKRGIDGGRVIVVGDVLRFRLGIDGSRIDESRRTFLPDHAERDRVRIGRLLSFEEYYTGSTIREPSITVEDGVTGERFHIDVENLRSLYYDWDGDAQGTLPLPASVLTYVEEMQAEADGDGEDSTFYKGLVQAMQAISP